MVISDEDRLAAERHLHDDLHSRPKAIKARFDRRTGRIVVGMDGGLEIAFPAHLAQGLEGANFNELAAIEISPLGDGLHWPALDADLYIPALLQGVFGSKPFMAAQLGAAGGRMRSEAKAVTARKNGRRGGRPRKISSA
jgi:hypothetical protein